MEVPGRYEKMRVLGRGSFGAVTLVKDHRDSKLYAMKTLNCADKLEERVTAMAEVGRCARLHVFVYRFLSTCVPSVGDVAQESQIRRSFTYPATEGRQIFVEFGKERDFQHARHRHLAPMLCVVW